MSGNLATAGMRVTAAWLNTNIPGTWIAITPMNGFTLASGAPPFQCRLSDSATLEIMGSLIIPSTAVDGVQIGQLPASVGFPSTPQGMNAVIANDSTVHGSSVNMTVRSNGSIALFSASLPGTAGTGNAHWTQVSFHVFVALDA